MPSILYRCCRSISSLGSRERAVQRSTARLTVELGPCTASASTVAISDAPQHREQKRLVTRAVSRMHYHHAWQDVASTTSQARGDGMNARSRRADSVERNRIESNRAGGASNADSNPTGVCVDCHISSPRPHLPSSARVASSFRC
jgi:hypothetical protein